MQRKLERYEELEATSLQGRKGNIDPHKLRSEVGQIILVFQGGGALGSYQAGVYHGLHQAGIEPDWIIGTSIGAINAALIAGNPPESRLAALQEFWHRVSHKPYWSGWQAPGPFCRPMDYWSILSGGLRNFFEPNHHAFLGPHIPLGVERAGYYSTGPLKCTLTDLVDQSRLNCGAPRITVGAAHVRSSRMHYFDSQNDKLSISHIMASGALPPAFPGVRIDGELYWDGGILSNTPTEVIFDDNPRRNSLVFAVHMWNPNGPEPETIWDVMHRQKDIQYSSRVTTQIARQKQIHRLRHIIKELSAYIPEEERNAPIVKEMLGWGCTTRMHVVRLLAPSLAYDDQTKDVDFSPSGIWSRWQAGYEHIRSALESTPWRGTFDPLEGVVLHEPPIAGERHTAAAERQTSRMGAGALPEAGE